ncbi:MAG: septation protein A [Pseudomonadota bacterium]
MTEQTGLSRSPKPEAPVEGPDQPPLGKMLLELGPLVVFFFVNSQYGIFVGTGWFMAATAVALTASWFLYGKVPVMPLVSGAFILVFGGLTLALADDTFIKIKPTIVNSIFATVLFGGLYFGHSLLKYLFGEVFALTEEGWRLLTFRWACFFVVLAVLNEVVWRSFSNEFWIGFKLFGIMPLTLVFAISQVGLLKRHELKSSNS